MSEASTPTGPHLHDARGRSLRRGLVVAVSATTFAICLTQTAYTSPGAYFDQLNEIPIRFIRNSAVSQLIWGWMALPFALLSLFSPNPFAIASVVVTAIFAWRKWRAPAAVVGCIALALMWKYHTLGLAAWLANPSLGAAWICYLLNRSRATRLLSGIAIILMLGFLSIDQVPFGPKGADVEITGYGMGYWLWLASAAIILTAAGADWLV